MSERPMGRKKKVVDVDEARFSLMEKSEKLELFHNFNQLFHYELSKIPYREIEVTRKGRAELIAIEHYKANGYDVYRSKVSGGYRCIGIEFYWKDYLPKVTAEDMLLIHKLKNLMTASEFEELAYLVKDKSGTPDLLLIKDEQISFVEVKFNYETVKHSTVEFFIRVGQRWPVSILRIVRK